MRGEREVSAFSKLMLGKLAIREHHGDWLAMTRRELIEWLEDEIEEFASAQSKEDEIAELVDIANLCMMIVDKHGGLE
jgi:hypothetical protein